MKKNRNRNGAPVYVIDCGSGSSRLSKYSYHDDGFIHEDLYIPSGIIPTLADCLSLNNQRQFVNHLKDALMELDDGACFGENGHLHRINLIVGATGGLRKALEEGAVKQEQLADFETLLRENFSNARFLQYSGAQEAGLELDAVRYIARHALPGAIPIFTGGRQNSGAVGVLSCGGSSSQIAYYDYDTKKDIFLSFRVLYSAVLSAVSWRHLRTVI